MLATIDKKQDKKLLANFDEFKTAGADDSHLMILKKPAVKISKRSATIFGKAMKDISTPVTGGK